MTVQSYEAWTCSHDSTGNDPDTATYCPDAVRSVVVLARTPEGHEAAMVLSNPPTAEDVARLASLAALPGLRAAAWSAAPGDSPR